MRFYVHSCVVLTVAVWTFSAIPAFSANPDFQDFFFTACVNPTGGLAARCGETTNAQGDLSGDSESSLNPSQGLSSNDAALTVAQTRSREARERSERLREGEPMADDSAVAIGPFSVMVHGRGAWFESDRVVDLQAERGYDGQQYAAEIGFDYRVSSNAVLGMLVGYEQVGVDFDAEVPGVNFTPAVRAGTTDSDTISITTFGVLNLTDNFYAEGTFGYGFSSYDFTRDVVFQESTRTAPQTNVRTSGDADGDSLWAGLNFGYDAQFDAWGLGTYAGLTFATSNIDSYTETDLSASGLNMTVAGFGRDSLLAHVGARTSYVFSTRGGVWIPSLRVEYAYDFDRDPQNINTSFVMDANQTNFTLRGDQPDDSYFNIALGIVGVLPNGWAPFLEVDAIVGYEDFSRTRVLLGIRKEL